MLIKTRIEYKFNFKHFIYKHTHMKQILTTFTYFLVFNLSQRDYDL